MTALNKFIIPQQKIILSALSGLLLTAGFPPVEWVFAPWIAFVFLFWAIFNLSASQSFTAGLVAGLAHYLSLLYWLASTMNIYGYLPIWLSVIFLILLSLYLSLYTAVFCAWVCIEYLREVLFSGFPWGLVGYSQHQFDKLIQIADVCGVYGISFLVVSANSLIFLALLYFSGRQLHDKKVNPGALCASALVFLCLMAGAMMYGNNRLKSVDQMMAKSKSVNVSVIQGNIAQDVKWDKEFCNATIEDYFLMSKQELQYHPSLVVWPETAAPFYFGYELKFTEKLLTGAQDAGVDFLLGAPTVDVYGKVKKFYNSAYLISRLGQVLGRYDKVHLVPWGEYVPFKEFFPFLGKIVEQVGDFDGGEAGSTLKWGDIDIGVLICYEVIFPQLAAKLVENSAGFLVSITNDAWFGKTGAPYQHFFMAMFRSIETRRSLVRSANTGISGFIDPAGRILGETAIFKEAAMTRKIPVIENYQTIYTRFGDVFVWLCFIAIMPFVMILLYKNFFRKGKN